MKTKIILPYNDQPLTVMYHNMAFPMGIIQGNAGTDITPWLCGKYVNCSFNNQSINKYNICLQDNWASADKILFFNRIDLIRENYTDFRIDILSILQKMLCNHLYVQGSYNEKHIPGKWAYQKEYYSHDYLLIGYDNILRIFHSVGYLSDGKFQRFDIPYENMLNAILSIKNERVAFNFWSYNPDAEYILNLQKVIESLDDYVCSKNSLKQYYNPETTWYGLDAIKMLGNYFIQESENGKCDHRYTRGLMEHKYFMRLRIEYLLKQGYLNNEKILSCAENVYRFSETVHMLGLKFSMTINKSIVVHMKEIIDKMIQVEKEYLPPVLEQLKVFSSTQGVVEQ